MSGPAFGDLQTGCDVLASRDPALRRAYEARGVPAWRVAPATYATLARLIVFQQISTIAGAAIWRRIEQAIQPLEAETLLQASDETLRSCGLSRPKMGHLRAIAAACQAGTLDPAALAEAPAGIAHEALVSVRGVGPWTANLFRLYAAGDLDAFPQGDLGLLESHRQLSGAAQRLDRDAFNVLAEDWRPYRGVAAHLLWDWLNHQRGTA